jgi:hypothetical protein
MPLESPYMLVSEAAAFLRVSEPMVHKLFDKKVLTKIRLPHCSRVLVARAEVESLTGRQLAVSQ